MHDKTFEILNTERKKQGKSPIPIPQTPDDEYTIENFKKKFPSLSELKQFLKWHKLSGDKLLEMQEYTQDVAIRFVTFCNFVDMLGDDVVAADVEQRERSAAKRGQITGVDRSSAFFRQHPLVNPLMDGEAIFDEPGEKLGNVPGKTS